MEISANNSKQQINVSYRQVKDHLKHDVNIRCNANFEASFIEIFLYCNQCEEVIGNEITFRMVED